MEVLNENLKKVQKIKDDLEKQFKIAQRLKHAQYSDANLDTAEKIYRYAAEHMGTLCSECSVTKLSNHMKERIDNELSNFDKEVRFEIIKTYISPDLTKCIDNCDLISKNLQKQA
ncbi:hypothetical protein LJC11_05760 [Bacteroidales bacterium OttesenSCG-928-I21]|nr:hypothetical protein [Bacteroidales bacterium OttesenSCG-928-I21]